MLDFFIASAIFFSWLSLLSMTNCFVTGTVVWAMVARAMAPPMDVSNFHIQRVTLNA